MSASLRLTPISGSSKHEPLCFLLEIDSAKILLDCGWSHSFSSTPSTPSHSYLEALRRVCTDLDAVLISHCDIQHLGALPYAVSNLGLQCPIYTTLPIWRMAQLELYEAFLSMNGRTDHLNNIFQLADVDSAFSQVVQLKYSQETHLTGRADGVVITPFNAGHSLGGCVWRISKETEEIVYAVDYNHRREGHLNGTVLEAAFSHPSVLITDANVSVVDKYVPRRKRETEFFDRILTTMRGGGNVLIPVDSPGCRTLEILFLLNHYWSVQRLGQFSLVLLSHVGYHVIEYAKSFIEWMSVNCQTLFNQNRDNPFDLKHVNLCYSVEELDLFMEDGPVLVLATSAAMDCSFAEDLLVRFAKEEGSLVVFPTTPEPDSLAEKVLVASNYGNNNQKKKKKEFHQNEGKGEREIESHSESGNIIKIMRKSKIPLEGAELAQFLAKQNLEKQSLNDENGDLESDSDEEGNDLLNGHSEPIFKRSVRLTPSFPMFMAKETKKVWDEYGEIVKLEDLLPEDSLSALNPAMGIGMGIQMNGKEKSDKEGMDVDMDMELDDIADEIPSKAVTEEIEIELECSVLQVNFEGHVDWRSMKNILQRVAPQKLVIVRGDESTKYELKVFCEANVCKTVSIPTNHQALMLTSDTSTFKVKLKDNLMKNLHLRPVSIGAADIYEVAYVNGRMAVEEFGIPTLNEIAIEDTVGHDAVFLGEVKLPDVRKTLALEGIDSEFVEGILVCDDGSINIRKVSENAIAVRGCLSQNYFYIRNVLYSHYQIV